MRPTSGKLKAAIFNVLFSLGKNADIEGRAALDLFAGSGALGIEALSRGAKTCCFIDNSAESVKVIRKNLSALGIGDSAAVLLKSYKAGLNLLSDMGLKFDIIFMDPPYRDDVIPQAIDNISKYSVLNAGGIIVAEHDIKVTLCEMISGFKKITEKYYSNKALSFYQALDLI